ncbi:Rab GTPase [Planoprotostelium fungivorum]|uniref:Ras-related protein Rab n=1 Tax=Planoprotostelium fungivorum TaxID=1890364 RepID=A0A2P6NRE4_9EUKA|nr:Rab GTPase [Planoprotostelium fungivorum]
MPVQLQSINEEDNQGEEFDSQQNYKVIVIGDYAVGKTSIIRRYTEGFFTPSYKLTIGVDFAVKKIHWDKELDISLQLWDVAGHERFGTMTSVYYKYAIAAIVVFDLSRDSTFDAVTKWRDDVNNKVSLANDDSIPMLLLANKCDVPGVVIDEEMLDEFCKTEGFIGWFKTSAATDTNIDNAMRFLVDKIIQVAKTTNVRRPRDENVFKLDSPKMVQDEPRQFTEKRPNCCG